MPAATTAAVDPWAVAESNAHTSGDIVGPSKRGASWNGADTASRDWWVPQKDGRCGLIPILGESRQEEPTH